MPKENIYNDLYERAKNGEYFTNLTPLVLSKENILLAHRNLIRQMWTLGIRDRHLLGKILRVLKTSIKMPDGKLIYPTKGTPQGGIISPLLANIVLNELDHWLESNWEENPVTYKYSINKVGAKSNGYVAMRKTNLKEIYIVRYADDFRIFCRTKATAEIGIFAR